jgi:hypothetical protein
MKLYSEGEQLKRIADAIEEILRLVKLDQEQLKKDGSMNQMKMVLWVQKIG